MSTRPNHSRRQFLANAAIAASPAIHRGARPASVARRCRWRM